MKDKVIRVDREFEKELKKMRLKRMRNGLDERMKSDRELTLAIRRHILFPQIKQSIIREKDLPKDLR